MNGNPNSIVFKKALKCVAGSIFISDISWTRHDLPETRNKSTDLFLEAYAKIPTFLHSQTICFKSVNGHMVHQQKCDTPHLNTRNVYCRVIEIN